MDAIMRRDLETAVRKEYRRVCESAERKAVRGEISDSECGARKLAARQRADKQLCGLATVGL